MSHLGKHLQLIEMGSSFLPFHQPTSPATQPLSVVTYCNDVSKTLTQLPSSSSSYRNNSTLHASMGTSSHFTGNSSSGRTFSSSSDCGYSSGRDSVSPHSLTSTAVSPPGVQIDCQTSPKINVEDLEDDEAAVDMTSSIPLNLVRRQSSGLNNSSLPSSEVVWRPF